MSNIVRQACSPRSTDVLPLLNSSRQGNAHFRLNDNELVNRVIKLFHCDGRRDWSLPTQFPKDHASCMGVSRMVRRWIRSALEMA